MTDYDRGYTQDLLEQKVSEQQATIADLQGQLLEWKRALHSLTPGGSEYANDSKACVEWVREARSRQHETIIDEVRQRKALQQHVAQLESAKKIASDAAVYHHRGMDLVHEALGCGDDVSTQKGIIERAKQLKADHARVLGLVQAAVVQIEQVEGDLHAALNGTRHDPSWIRPIQLSRNERQELYLGCESQLKAIR